jgi:hypothetical protein
VHLVAVTRSCGAEGEQLDGVLERQRLQLHDGLAGKLERDLAGAQDAQVGRGVEQALGQRGGV